MSPKKDEKKNNIPSQPHRKEKPPGADGHRQRMYERLIRTIDYRIAQRDALEMLMYFSIPVSDTRDQAVLLMRDNGNNIMNVLNANSEKLLSIRGVGPKTVKLFRTISAAVKRGLLFERTTPSPPGKCYTEIDDITALFLDATRNVTQAETWIASFNSAMQLQKVHMLVEGELTTSPAHMRVLLDYTTQSDVKRIAIAKVCKGCFNFSLRDEKIFFDHVERAFYYIGREIVDYVIINDTSDMMPYIYRV